MSTQPGILHIDRANDYVVDPKFKIEHQMANYGYSSQEIMCAWN